MMNNITWDEYFMMLVHAIAMKSKDESTHQGALIVDDTNRMLTSGYNSFPSGINDNLPERQVRPYKYHWFEHAERNAIYTAARRGIALDGGIMYVTGVPCTDCARAIIQAGIRKVIYPIVQDESNTDHWTEEAKITRELLAEANVKLIKYIGNITTKITSRRRGIDYLNGKKEKEI